MSIFAPASLNSALMVVFKKMRYMKYTCNAHSTLFQSRRKFEQYEAALELSYLLGRAIAIDEMEYASDVDVNLDLQIRQLKSALLCVACKFIDEEELISLVETWTDKGYEILVGIVSALAYIRYCCSLKSAIVDKGTDRPEYLIQFDAGFILSTVVFAFVSTIEKECSGRQYDLAIYLLELLLSMNHNPSRKGKIYIRLAIDYNHINKQQATSGVIIQGVADSSVCYGDRLNLQRRNVDLDMKSPSLERRDEERMKIDYTNLELRFQQMIQQYSYTESASTTLTEHIIDLSDDITPIEWTCTVCTLINKPSFLVCEACESPFMPTTQHPIPTFAPKSTVEVSDQDIIVHKTKRKSSKSAKQVTIIADEDDRTSDDDLLTTVGESQSSHSFLEAIPAEFTIISRRTNLATSQTTTPNYGKSKFYDIDDDLVTVEDFVLKKCHTYDTDDLEYAAFIEAIDGGGWQGWHCEGSYLRSLYGLLLWDVIFYDQIPNTFLTSHQDHPIDLLYPAFYKSREDLILGKVDYIANMTLSELIETISSTYRNYYRMECCCVSWYHPLRHLQLIAICIGPKSLSRLCLDISRSYRHYRSGAPDLLLIRIKHIEEKRFIDVSDFLGDDWQNCRRATTNTAQTPMLTTSPEKPLKHDDDDDNESIEGLPLESKEGERKPPAKDRFACEEIDVHLPESWDSAYSYEGMFVEVKGPNDILADKQRIWLSTLAAAGLRSYVGRVKESKPSKRNKVSTAV